MLRGHIKKHAQHAVKARSPKATNNFRTFFKGPATTGIKCLTCTSLTRNRYKYMPITVFLNQSFQDLLTARISARYNAITTIYMMTKYAQVCSRIQRISLGLAHICHMWPCSSLGCMSCLRQHSAHSPVSTLAASLYRRRCLVGHLCAVYINIHT